VDAGEKAGHIVLKSLYHCFLNLIKLTWSLVKCYWQETHPVSCRLCEICLNWL